MDHFDQSRDLDIRLEKLLGQLALRDPTAKAWHEVLVRLNAFDVDGAAGLARKAIGNGLDTKLVESIITSINAVAVLNGITGPGMEAMSIRAADSGFPDLACNAGNYLYSRAATPEEYQLAESYYLLAYGKSNDAAIRASSIANCAAIIRDGEITSVPDWPGAVVLYEKAAALGLIAGMFNAGNVCMWLVDKGNMEYADRAAKWFETVIDCVESGRPSVDSWGEKDRSSIYGSARMRLAEIYARDLVPGFDLDACTALVAPYLGLDQRARWCLNLSVQKNMGSTKAKPSKTSGGNWKSVLEMMRWNTLSSTPFDYGVIRGVETKGDLLLIESESGPSMPFIVMDCFVHPEFESFSVMVDLAYGHFEKLGQPCFIVGSKGYFTHADGKDFSLLFHIDGSEFTSVPIWPGATSAEVLSLAAMAEAERFVDTAADMSNCIPILVNALSEGHELTGDGLPSALWLGAGKNLRFPILSSKEPASLGLTISITKEQLDEHFETHRQSRSPRPPE